MLDECNKSEIHATRTYSLSRSSSLNSLQAQLGARRNSASSLGGGKENVPSFPMLELLAAPPELSEETLLATEHKEILGKLKFVCTLVDTILEVSGMHIKCREAWNRLRGPIRAFFPSQIIFKQISLNLIF